VRYPQIKINIEKIEIEPDIKILLSERPWSNTVDVFGSFNIGSFIENMDNAGITNFTNMMILRGTRYRTARKIIEDIESLGSSIEFITHYERTFFSIRCLRSNFKKTIYKIFKYARNAVFPENQVELVRGIISTAIDESEQYPFRVAEKNFRKILFPKNHPLHREIIGYKNTIKKIKRDSINKHFKKYYSANNMIIGICGGVDKNIVKKTFKEILSDWSGIEIKYSFPKVEKPSKKVSREIEMPGKSEARIRVGSIAVPYSFNRECIALSLVDNALGRFGLMGRLGKKIRDEAGLAYGVWSNIAWSKNYGYWMINAGVNPRNIEKALKMIYSELDEISSKGITEEELKRVKNNTIGSLITRLEENSYVARLLHSIEYYNLGLDYFEKIRKMVEGISLKDCRKVAEKHYQKERSVEVIVKPKK